MLPPEEAIKQISRELSQIYRQTFGRSPDAELVRDEAEHIVEKFGPIMAIKEIFSQDEEISGASRKPSNEEQSQSWTRMAGKDPKSFSCAPTTRLAARWRRPG